MPAIEDDDSDVLGGVEEFVVGIDDIATVEPLPVKDYLATVESVNVRFVEKDGKESVTKVTFGYKVPVEQFPPSYDVDNAPTGAKLFTPFNGTRVECGNGAQPTRQGQSDWKRVLKAHGYTGEVRFIKRPDIGDRCWSLADDFLQNELVGRSVILSIVHNKSIVDDQVYAQIKSVKPVQ